MMTRRTERVKYRRVRAPEAPRWWGFPCWWVDGIGVVHRLRDAKKSVKRVSEVRLISFDELMADLGLTDEDLEQVPVGTGDDDTAD